MADPKFERVLAAAEAALRNIAQADGYYMDAGACVYGPETATGARTPIESWTRFPALFVEFGGDDIIEGCVGEWRSDVDLVVVGYVQSKRPRRDAIALLADARRALLTSDLLNGLLTNLEPDTTRTDIGILGATGHAYFVTRFRTHVEWAATDQ